jgi:hypothetical protein
MNSPLASLRAVQAFAAVARAGSVVAAAQERSGNGWRAK